MTLQAQRIAFGSQQFRPIPAVRLMASCAPLLERRLMQDVFLRFLGSIRVATQADTYGIRLRKSWRFSGVWAVAVGAISHGSGVLHLGTLNFLRLLCVAGRAHFFGAGLRQNNFAFLGRLMADFALFLGERQMHESLHQFWPFGLVRIVARQTIGLLEGLILVGFDQ